VTDNKKMSQKLEFKTIINEEHLNTCFSLGKVKVDPKKVKIITGEELLNLIDHL
jgi:YbbR domain-containing protein